MASRSDSESERGWFDPNSCIHFNALWCNWQHPARRARRFQVQTLAGQLGGKQSPGSILCAPSISHSCSPIGRGGCLKTSQRAGSNPARSTNYAPVAQLEEAIALEAMRCRFKSCQEYQASGCNSVVRSLGLGPRSRGFKSYHPDHLPLSGC